MDIRKVFGRNVQKARVNMGKSQEELAELSGLHRTYIGSVERGERNIGIINIQKLSNALGVEIHTLFLSGK